MCNIWLDKQNGKDREEEEERMSMLEKKIHKDATSAIEKYRKQNVKYSIV